MAKGSKGYFGFGRVLSIIFAIIPVTAWLFGFITRFMEGKIVAGILRLIGLGFIMWILDLIFMIAKGTICRILPC